MSHDPDKHSHHCHEHSHDHGDDHHHHEHGHSHDAPQSGPVTGDAGKLKVLVEHWIKHNTEHQAALEEWTGKAKVMNMAAVAAALEKSARNMEKSVEDLKRALKLFD